MNNLRYKVVKTGIFIWIFISCQSSIINAQHNNDMPKVQIGGFVRYDFFIDTYESVDSRDGEFYLYPQQRKVDSLGNDINKSLQLEMLSLLTRINLKTQNFTILGAETYAFIEADFLGTSQQFSRLFRLRHAYMKLRWSNKAELLMGQYWHPMFDPELSPQTVTWASGLPFTAFNRSPQIRFSYQLIPKINLLIAASSQGYHYSLPSGYTNGSVKNSPQRDAFIPDLQFRALFNNNWLSFSLHAGYKFLKPRMITERELKTKKVIGTYNLAGYSKIKLSGLDINLGTVFGEDLVHLLMIGGYGARDNPELVDDYKYSALRTIASWVDITTKGRTFTQALFLGYTENLGSKNNFYSLGYSRGENIKYLYTIAPRFILDYNRLKFRLEYKYTLAVYGSQINNRGIVIDLDSPVYNNRFIFSALYQL